MPHNHEENIKKAKEYIYHLRHKCIITLTARESMEVYNLLVSMVDAAKPEKKNGHS
jgi:hypothetical protein